MEIWLARSEPYMSASEQALLLLEALSSGDVGIFLSGKPLALFIRKDGVQQILDALRLHYSAHLHLRQSEALSMYRGWHREDGESIGHALLRYEALCDQVIQVGLAHPSNSLPQAQRMIGLLSDLRLSPEQRREVYTNTFLQHDYDGAVAALRVLYPSVNHTDVPFIKPATSKDQQHRDRVRQPSAKATDTLATLKESIMKASSPEEALSILASSTKTRTPPRTNSRTAVRRDRRKRNTNKPLNPVATSGNLPWEEHLGKLMCFSCGSTGQWQDFDGDLRHLTCTHCRGSMIESLLLREQR